MKCSHCGTDFADGLPSCPNCGAPASPDGQPGTQGQPYPQPGMGYPTQQMTKKEFLRHENLKKTKSGINSAAIIAYICGVISFVAGYLLLDTGMYVIVDLLLLVGLGLGIQLGQSRVCSILLLAYAILNVISGIMETGRPTGYLILIAAIDAVIFTFRFQKAWKEYQSSGIVPVLK